MKLRFLNCPVCDDYMTEDDSFRFGMCRECFTDSLTENISENILRDFFSEYRQELIEYVGDNYI